jgi:hypothetical protein
MIYREETDSENIYFAHSIERFKGLPLHRQETDMLE